MLEAIHRLAAIHQWLILPTQITYRDHALFSISFSTSAHCTGREHSHYGYYMNEYV
jgi:hypothetical protein